MLKHLSFRNFKAWESMDMPGAPITGIFGTNSSGKSSILQMLLLLKQTKDATDRAVALDLNGSLVQLGTMTDLLHQHDETKPVSWQLDWHEPSAFTIKDPSEMRASPLASGQDLSIRAEVRAHNSSAWTSSLAYEFGGRSFCLKPKSGSSTEFILEAAQDPSAEGDFRFTRNKGRAWRLPGPMKSYAFPDQVRAYYQNAGFLSDLEARYEGFLDRVYYLGPLREDPKRDYLWSRSKPSDVGLRGEKAIDAILAATEAGWKRNLRPKSRRMPFQAMIAHWLREMKMIHSFRVEQIAEGSNRWQARVKTSAGSSEVFLTDVGFGVSQVLPVITLLQYVPEGSTVLLEQPEIHLHPLAQAELAEVIIQAVNHRKLQVIVESHSEHLLLRLQRRIAEGRLPHDDIKFYFCDSRRGASRLNPLQVDLFGKIGNWPSHFMGDAFGETAKAEKARLQRMSGAE